MTANASWSDCAAMYPSAADAGATAGDRGGTTTGVGGVDMEALVPAVTAVVLVVTAVFTEGALEHGDSSVPTRSWTSMPQAPKSTAN